MATATARHTTGPWRVEKLSGSPLARVFGPGEPSIETEICTLYTGYKQTENASLIAAAPDLLLACKMALNDRMFKDWPPIATALIAAIAKAEGHEGQPHGDE